jgi:ABC-type sugar transport system ATPase subunit
MVKIVKDFPGVRALNNVTFEANYGEVLACIGENGAGKSTLMKVLSGVWEYPTYKGEIYIDDQLKKFSNTKEAEENGIAIIYQELNLIPELSVAENIFLDRQKTGKIGSINWNQVYSETKKYLDTLEIADVKPTSLIKDLTVGKQQMIEIAKALSIRAKIIVFDEPTSALTEKETKALFKVIKKLKANNVCMIYISHKMDEIQQIADKIFVLRDGESIGDVVSVNEISMDDIIKRMVGRELKDIYPKISLPRGEKVLEVKNFTVDHPFIIGEKIVKEINFSAYQGEILGIAGLMGSGRSELVSGIFGAFSKDVSGEVYLNGKKVNIRTPKEAIEQGIALVTEDRKTLGLILDHSVVNNITLSSLDTVSNNLGVIDKLKERNIANKYVDKLKIKVPNLDVQIEKLSGGNQQKVILGKWLNTSPKILILDEPTRGIDVGAKSEIYKIMNSLIEQGVVVIMISSELPEIMGMSDRILVMSEGKLCADLKRNEATKELVIGYCTGNVQEVDK